MKKKILVIILILLIVMTVGYVFFLIKYNNSNKNLDVDKEVKEKNTNESFWEDISFDGITVSNISCIFDGTYSNLKYTITNNNDTPVLLSKYKTTIKDKDGRIIIEVDQTTADELGSKEKYESSVFIDLDLSDAYTMEINFNEEDGGINEE